MSTAMEEAWRGSIRRVLAVRMGPANTDTVSRLLADVLQGRVTFMDARARLQPIGFTLIDAAHTLHQPPRDFELAVRRTELLALSVDFRGCPKQLLRRGQFSIGGRMWSGIRLSIPAAINAAEGRDG